MSELPPSTHQTDWNRLQKALSVEAERGFNNLEGRQQRFNEFLQNALATPPAPLSAENQGHWRSLSAQYAHYSDLPFAERQHLVAETRRTLYATKRSLEIPTPKTATVSAGTASNAASPRKVQTARAQSSLPRSNTAQAGTSTPASRLPDLEQSV
ncbi:MAG: DNA helicase RecG, partial [Leptolyngbya sp. SIO1D8]|nr:DNA helicase RecG [Leptolyngbya sp. SIO1D8]